MGGFPWADFPAPDGRQKNERASYNSPALSTSPGCSRRSRRTRRKSRSSSPPSLAPGALRSLRRRPGARDARGQPDSGPERPHSRGHTVPLPSQTEPPPERSSPEKAPAPPSGSLPKEGLPGPGRGGTGQTLPELRNMALRGNRSPDLMGAVAPIPPRSPCHSPPAPGSGHRA